LDKVSGIMIHGADQTPTIKASTLVMNKNNPVT